MVSLCLKRFLSLGYTWDTSVKMVWSELAKASCLLSTSAGRCFFFFFFFNFKDSVGNEIHCEPVCEMNIKAKAIDQEGLKTVDSRVFVISLGIV